VCSVIHEGVTQMFALRWKSLDVALNDTLDPADYSKFMAHPPIKNLWGSSRKPTLIPKMVAARAIVHAFEPADQSPITDATELPATWPAVLQRQIVPFLNKEIDSVQDLYQAAQSGFDNSVIAASDWYARQAHGLSILVAILFAIALNIDTVAIATKLAQEPIQRATLVELAQNTVKQDQEYPTSVCPDLGTTIKPKTSIMDSRISTILLFLRNRSARMIAPRLAQTFLLLFLLVPVVSFATISHDIAMPGSPSRIAVNPINGKLYSGSATSMTLVVVSLAINPIINKIYAATIAICWS